MKTKILILSMLLQTSAATTFAEGGTTGPLAWTISSDGKTLTISGTGAMPDYEYSGDAPWHSYCSSITTVVIEEGVTSIGDYAFYVYQSLTSISTVTIPSSVTSIGNDAFSHCPSLTFITIPSSVTSIGDMAFFACLSLTAIQVENGNVNYSSEAGVLFNKNKTTLICCPGGKTGNYTIPISVRSIGDWAFATCQSLASITIPSSVTSIGDYAFYLCSSLTSVTNLNPTPQNVSSSVFSYVDLSNATLYVPAASIETYQAADVWKNFGTFRSIEDAGKHWQADGSLYPNTMTVTLAIKLNGLELQSENMEIAAFAGEECRGSVLIQNYPEVAAHPYLGFLTIHGNDGETITFKAFNHETEKEYEATNAPLLFVIDAVNGNPDTPYEVTISDIVTQQIPLAEGWTWISTNVTPTETPIIEQFIQTIGSAGILLKSRDRFIQAPYWIGTLSEINNREMYMVKTGATANLSLAGLPAVPATTSIVLQNGWNWVGYVPQAPLPINEALANLNPQDGDQIKSYSAYSVYSDGSGWTGSLQTLNPGEGYKYFSQTAQSFVYSEWAPAYPSPGIRSNIAGDQPRWAIEKHRYPNNITATVVALLDDTEWQSDRIEIGAFVGEECRGSVFLQYVPQVSEHPYMGFLVVYGDGDEEIRLRVYNHATGEEYDATNKLSFKADTIYGAPATPYRITSLTTGIDDVVDWGLRVYPNPVQSELFIQSERPIERVEITDVSGRAVVSTNSTTVNVSHLPRGVYSAKIFIGNQSFVKKIVKQ